VNAKRNVPDAFCQGSPLLLTDADLRLVRSNRAQDLEHQVATQDDARGTRHVLASIFTDLGASPFQPVTYLIILLLLFYIFLFIFLLLFFFFFFVFLFFFFFIFFLFLFILFIFLYFF